MNNSLYLIILIFLFACSQKHKEINPAKKIESKKEQTENSTISYNIISTTNNTWCYDILVNGKVFIHQPNIPGVPGNEGFKTKEDAAKVAETIIRKIKNGEMPPSMTVEELKNIGVL